MLITYNGNVCFTPYFASASTGTASAADVWGNDRAWLQAVESPYDQSTATHWNTNGATSGTARFSRATLQQRILDVLGIDLSGVDPNSWFKILSANQYGWDAALDCPRRRPQHHLPRQLVPRDAAGRPERGRPQPAQPVLYRHLRRRQRLLYL